MKKTIFVSMLLISAFALSACSFGGSKSVKIVTDEYDFDENVENIQIDISCEDIHIMASEDDECHVVFSHPESPKTTVEKHTCHPLKCTTIGTPTQSNVVFSSKYNIIIYK